METSARENRVAGAGVAVLALQSPLTPALARRLAAEGAEVVLVGPDGEPAGALLGEIDAAGRGRGHFFRMERGDDAEIDGLVEFLGEQFWRRRP